jgi:hypothetical protein
VSGSALSLSREELEQIPPRYRWVLRLLLKLPEPGFPDFVLRRLPGIEGIYWAMIVPIFLIIYFFVSIWLVSFLSFHVMFPFNILFGLSMPAIFLVIFIRVQLERAIALWRSAKGSEKEWNVSKVVGELVELTRRQRQIKHKRTGSSVTKG